MAEVIASLSLFLTIMLTLIPIIYQINLEEQVLKERRGIQSLLHDELQAVVSNAVGFDLPENYHRKSGNQSIYFIFIQENKLIKGCANWKNAKELSETFCLYGYPQ